MPLDFPSSATTGSIYTGTNGVLYTYDGVKWVGSSPQGSIIPSANLTYDLGSTSSQWRSLYVGTSTIYLGGTALSIAGGSLTVDGSPVAGGGVATTSTLVNGAYTVSLGSTGTLTVPANGIITAPVAQEFQLQAKDTDSVLRNEINLDPNNGTYMSVWSDETTSFSFNDWGSGSWNNESGLGAARFTDAQALQDFWTTGNGSLGLAYEVSINGGPRTPNVFYDGNNGEQYGVTLGLDAVPPGGQGTTVPITSLVFYYRTQSKINMDVDGGEILLDGQALNINLQTTNSLNLQSGQTLDIKNIGQQPVRIFTDNTTHVWEFDSGGSLTLPREGRITGIGDGGPAGDRYGYISWDGNSSGDGSGFNTMRLVPDLLGLEDLDQYIIIDPTGGVPGHIHIRAGGTQDNSLANLYLGGENSHVKISAGANPPVTVMANSSTWTFGTDGLLTFPDGTTSTGASVYVPYATSSSFKVTTEIETGPGSYFPVTFQVQGTKIVLPGGNGAIQAGSEIWNLDSGNKQFSFPNLSRINYGDGDYLSTGTLEVDVRDGGIFQIRLNDYNKTWTFNNSGDLNVPGTIRQGDNYLNLNSPGTGIILLSDTSTVKIIADYATNGGAAWTFESNLSFTAPNGGDIVFNSSTNSYIYGVTGIEFANATTQTTAWTKAAASVQSTPPSSPVTGQLYYDTDDGRTYIYTGAAWIDSSPASAAGVTSITAGTGTFVSSTTGNITIWNTGSVASVLKETFETKNASTGTTIHDCTTNRLFYLTNLGTNFTPNFTNLNLSSGDATSVSLVVLQTSTARSVTGVQIASTTSGVSLIWQGSITAPSGNASRTEVFSFSIMCTGTNAYTVLGMMTSFGGA